MRNGHEHEPWPGLAAGLGAGFFGTGLITLVPLVLFAAGVRRLKLSTIGLMQYLAPSLSFILAVFLFGEPFSSDHAVTFGCVWAALVLFTWAGWRHYRRGRIIAGAAE